VKISKEFDCFATELIHINAQNKAQSLLLPRREYAEIGAYNQSNAKKNHQKTDIYKKL